MIKFKGSAKVIPALHRDNQDAYLCIGDDAPVLKIGRKGDVGLQEMADALNAWKESGHEDQAFWVGVGCGILACCCIGLMLWNPK